MQTAEQRGEELRGGGERQRDRDSEGETERKRNRAGLGSGRGEASEGSPTQSRGGGEEHRQLFSGRD